MNTTPYPATIETYSLTVEHLNIEMINFIHPVSSFQHDVWPLTFVKGNWTDKDFHKSCEVKVEIMISGTKPFHTCLKFVGKFSVKKQDPIKVPHLSVRLVEYCADIIKDYINEKPVKDKDGNLYPTAQLMYSEDRFQQVVFD